MSTYQTKRLFGDRPATVGADVIVAAQKHNGEVGETCLRAGKILMISASRDLPYVHDLTDKPRDNNGKPTCQVEDWNFVKTTTVAEAEAMPAGSWTWPLPSLAINSDTVLPVVEPESPKGTIWRGTYNDNPAKTTLDGSRILVWYRPGKSWVLSFDKAMVESALKATILHLLSQTRPPLAINPSTVAPVVDSKPQHHLKTQPEPFRAILRGDKLFEIRKDDRAYLVGDRILLQEFEPCSDCAGSGNGECWGENCELCEGKKGYYTGDEQLVEVTYIASNGQWGLPVGLCVLGIKKV